MKLTPEEFGNYTVAEIDALFAGWQRRYEHLEDLLIVNCALPVYRVNLGRKAPTYKQLTAYRHKNRKIGEIDPELVKIWKDRL